MKNILPQIVLSLLAVVPEGHFVQFGAPAMLTSSGGQGLQLSVESLKAPASQVTTE